MPIITNQQPNAMQPQDPQQASPQGRRQRGTGFTNIRNLLQANVGAGGVMGAGLGAGLGKKAGQLRQDVQTAGQQFGQQYQQEKEKTLGQGGSVAGVGEYLAGGQDVSGLSEEEARKIGKGLAESQYTGPMELANQQSLLSRAGNIQALSTLAGMGGIGQGRLLQGSATRRGGYSRGQNLLDQYLIGQDVAAQEAIRQGAAEASGAVQQAQTGVDVAAQQAEGLKTSIEAQKEQTKQDVLKALAGTQDQATQSAKQFLAQADRIKQAIAAMGGEEGIDVSLLNAEDLAALQNLQAYGINPTTVTTVDDLSNLLKGISSSAITQFSGQQRYLTDAEQKAARNLALLSGQEDVAKKISGTEFDPKLFSDANSTIKAQVEGSNITTKGLEDKFNVNTPEGANKLVKDFDFAMSTANRVATSGAERGTPYVGDAGDLRDWIGGDGFGKQLSNSFWPMAVKYLGKQTIIDIADRIDDEEHGFLGISKSSNEYQQNRIINEVRDRLNAVKSDANKLKSRYDSRMTLQDYFNKRLGVTPQQGS